MITEPRAAEILVETGAYIDLTVPKILVEGTILAPYYIEVTKTLQDGGKWKEYGNDSKAMTDHAIKVAENNPLFDEFTDILAIDAKKLLSDISYEKRVISGGQRKDWPVSGSVAHKLGLPHLSLYKQKPGEKDKSEVIKNGTLVEYDLKGKYVLHIADMNTRGSSALREEKKQKKGWVPMIRNLGAEIEKYFSVVTRLQGGEARLAEEGISAYSEIAIDEKFLREQSDNPEVTLVYIKDPKQWTEDYLRENGALEFLDTFNPRGSQIQRGRKFIRTHKNLLRKARKLGELDNTLRDKYNVSIEELIGE